MNYDKILRVYVQHVLDNEGITFASSWHKQEFVTLGLSDDEADTLIAIAAEIDRE